MVMDVSVEGVKVKGVVGTGSQSTIIFRQFLHSIKHHLLKEGNAIPVPVTKLYHKGGTPLDIAAQIHLTFSADGKTARIPVFIQPAGVCSNVLSPLGVTIRCASGGLLGTVSNPTLVARVQVVHTVHVPGRTGMFAEAEISEPCNEGEALVFEKFFLAECVP